MTINFARNAGKRARKIVDPKSAFPSLSFAGSPDDYCCHCDSVVFFFYTGNFPHLMRALRVKHAEVKNATNFCIPSHAASLDGGDRAREELTKLENI